MFHNVRVFPDMARSEAPRRACDATDGQTDFNQASVLPFAFTYKVSTVVLFTRSITKLVRQS